MLVRTRSAAYPSYSLSFCLDFVKGIYKNFGSSYYANRDELSKVLHISEGHIQTQISSSVQYGILELKSREGYKVSPLFVKYQRPIDKSDEREALIEMFKSPTLYNSVIELINGDIMPQLVPLSNIMLHKFNIAEKVCEKAASVFIENVEYIRLLDSDGHLNVNTSEHSDVEENVSEMDSDTVEQEASDYSEQKHNRDNMKLIVPSTDNKKSEGREDVTINSIPFNIPLKGRRTAQVIIPNDANPTDFDVIINWVRLMKESFD